MSICSNVTIKREKAANWLLNQKLDEHKDLLIRAINAMSNSDIASELNKNEDLYYYEVEGKYKLKYDWERESQ